MEQPIQENPLFPADQAGFWKTLDSLVESSRIVIDRPTGSSHPRFPEMVYPRDYGYLEGTTGGDGAGIDVWIGSLPGGGVCGIACSVDLFKKDAEIKVLIGCTPTDVDVILEHMNNDEGLKAVAVLRKR